MDQLAFNTDSLSQDTTDGRSQVQSNRSMVGAPVDVHEKICKIVSLLSQALVLTLSLLKSVMSTRDVHSDNRLERMPDEEQQPLLPAPGQLELPDPASINRFRRHMANGNITFTRGQGSWSGYSGAGADNDGSAE